MYSRRTTIEEKKNTRTAFLFILLTIGGILLLFFWGIPSIAKFAAFLGDLRQSSEPVDTNDTTPPPPPRFEPIPQAINQSSVEIRGSGETASTVVLTINSKKDEVVVNSEGKFFKKITLSEGNNDISAYSVDQAGNESQKSEKLTIIYDKEPPILDISRPTNGTEFFGSLQRQIIIEGKIDPDSSVNINGRLVIIDSQGGFSFATTLSEGENNFTLKAQDIAGNQTEKSLKVTFTP